MTTLTAITDQTGIIQVSATNGDITIEQKGKKILPTIIKALFKLWIEEISEVLESFRA